MTKSKNKVIQDILNLIVTDNDINKEGKYNGYYISGSDKIAYSNSVATRLITSMIRGHYFNIQDLKRSEVRALDFKQSLLEEDCTDINLQRADDNLKGVQQALSIMIAEIPLYDEALGFFTQKPAESRQTYSSIVNSLRNNQRRNNIQKAKVREYKPLTKSQLNKISIDDTPIRMPFGDNEMSSDLSSDIDSHTKTVLNGCDNPNVDIQHSETIA